jgi:hypothetical protein
MATKLITDLQDVASVTDDANFPMDDGIQTYRATAPQIKTYVLPDAGLVLGKLAIDIFNGLSGVTPVAADYLPFIDTSDSNKTKKLTFASIKNAAYRSVTSTDAVGTDDETMKLSGASFTSTLPTAVGVAGKRYKFIHGGTSLSQIYTMQTTSAQTIGGVAGGSFVLYTNGEVLEVESDGANWMIIGRNTKTAWTSAAITLEATGGGTNPTKATTTIRDFLAWMRDGRYWYYTFLYYHTSSTGAANGTNNYTLKAPTNITFDTTIQVADTTLTAGDPGLGSEVGQGSSKSTADTTTGGDVRMFLYDSTHLAVWLSKSTGQWWGNNTATSSYKLASSGTLLVGGTGRVVVSGWQP